MLVKPIKLGRRSRQTDEIPCTHISVKEEYDDDHTTLLSVRIEICGGPPDAPKSIHMPNDAHEFYVMDDRGNHQDSFKFEQMKRAVMIAHEKRKARGRMPTPDEPARMAPASSEVR